MMLFDLWDGLNEAHKTSIARPQPASRTDMRHGACTVVSRGFSYSSFSMMSRLQSTKKVVALCAAVATHLVGQRVRNEMAAKRQRGVDELLWPFIL